MEYHQKTLLSSLPCTGSSHSTHAEHKDPHWLRLPPCLTLGVVTQALQHSFLGFYFLKVNHLNFHKKQVETSMKPSRFFPKMAVLIPVSLILRAEVATSETQLWQASASSPDSEGAQYKSDIPKQVGEEIRNCTTFGSSGEKCSVI